MFPPCKTCSVQTTTKVSSIQFKIHFFFKKGIKKITRLLDSAKSVEMLTCCKGDSSEKIKSLNRLYTSKGDEQITYSTTNLAAIN